MSGSEDVLSDWRANELAESLLADPLPRRWLHSLGVQQRALRLKTAAGEDLEVLSAAAVLHDVGYAPTIAHTGFHALDGARHLASLGVDDRVVRLVAHHSCAAIEAEGRGLGAQLAVFALEKPALVDALICADMTTTPDGRRTTVGERIEEIVARYGPDSVVGRFIRAAEPELRAACSRVDVRAHQH